VTALWRSRRRIRQLQDAIAAAEVSQAELRARLEFFEQIAAAAGAQQNPSGWWGATVPAAPMPASLIAAANEHGTHQVPVRLEVAGTEVIAVISGRGDPREWWSAAWQLAAAEGPSR